MLYALLNNEKVEAKPQMEAICPCCEGKVFSKCGEIKIWHWAHKKEKDESCDNWYEPETDWHYYWKMAFGKENSEVVIKKENKKHIADVCTKNKVIIELQNSPIQKQVIRQREEFYGERMIWIINGLHFSHNFTIHSLQADDIKKSELSTHWFVWNRSRKSWKDVKRHILIDFGGDNLFCVKDGMGDKVGEGYRISKKFFFDRQKGNYNFYIESQKKKIVQP
jgi:competence protein CoiA